MSELFADENVIVFWGKPLWNKIKVVGDSGLKYHNTRFRIIEPYKGDVTGTVRVQHEVAQDCGPSLPLREPSIVFGILDENGIVHSGGCLTSAMTGVTRSHVDDFFKKGKDQMILGHLCNPDIWIAEDRRFFTGEMKLRNKVCESAIPLYRRAYGISNKDHGPFYKTNEDKTLLSRSCVHKIRWAYRKEEFTGKFELENQKCLLGVQTYDRLMKIREDELNR